MDDRELKRLLQEDMKMEAEDIINKVNSDPSMADVEVPPTLREKVFSQIREIEEENARNQLSQKDQELVRLGKKYKKSRRLNIYVIIAAAIICALSVSVSAMGGPEKVFEKFKKSVSGRELSYVNTDDERTDEIDTLDVIEAYEKIEEEYNVRPVRLDYLPDGMEYVEMSELEDIQSVQLIYEDEKKGVIKYRMNFNYRTGSTGFDVEDKIVEEYEREIGGATISVKKYLVEENGTERWNVKFEYQDVLYTLLISGLNRNEVEYIVENLYIMGK